MKSTKKGFSLVELGIVVAIMTVIVGIVAVNGYNLYQNSVDTKVQQDLKALTESTQLFMVDTNGEAPCWSPKAKEGTGVAEKETSICKGKYDYTEQGKGSGAAKDIDFDGTGGEEFTPQNILAPAYINAIPNPARSGQNYLYTRGKNDTVQGKISYAYSAPLAGNKANDKLLANNSILNEKGVVAKTVEKACGVSDLYKGTVTEAGTLTYKVYTGLKTDTGITTKDDCDIYSDGLNVTTKAFDEKNTVTSISVQPQ